MMPQQLDAKESARKPACGIYRRVTSGSSSSAKPGQMGRIACGPQAGRNRFKIKTMLSRVSLVPCAQREWRSIVLPWNRGISGTLPTSSDPRDQRLTAKERPLR